MTDWAQLVQACAKRGMVRFSPEAESQASKLRTMRERQASWRAANPEKYRQRNREEQRRWRERRKAKNNFQPPGGDPAASREKTISIVISHAATAPASPGLVSL